MEDEDLAALFEFNDGLGVVGGHHYPLGDTREHRMDRGCWCGPYIEWDIEDGVYRYRHIAEDCREFWVEDMREAEALFFEVWEKELTWWRGMN